MIQSLPCPGCHRTLVLAKEASLKAVLRCKHCDAQFVLGEMIESSLGFWDVVEDPNPPTQALVAATAEPNQSTSDERVSAELELAQSEFESPQAILRKQASKQDVDWSKFEPITHEQFEKMRRKSKSPIWSMVSVLLGGVASIPVATLLIWHLLGKDPFQAGPTVARYLPWVVPAQFMAEAID